MPNWNYLHPDPIFMDIESQSAANLRKVGAKTYIRDASTRLLSAVFKRGNTLVVWVPPGRAPAHYQPSLPQGAMLHTGDDVPDVVKMWVAGGGTMVAHNAESFDAEFWERHVKLPCEWLDTIHLARHAGYPAGLGKLSEACGGPGKGDDTAMHLLCVAKVKGGGVWYPVGQPPLWDDLLRYNIQDVVELERIYGVLMQVPIPDAERRMLQLNALINSRGVRVDLQFARVLRDTWTASQLESTDLISEMTGGKLNATNIRSPHAVKAFIKGLGIECQSLDKRQIEQILDDPESHLEDPESTEAQLYLSLLAERQNAVRSTVGKLDRLFTVTDPDSRVRNCIVYHGAHTGRFSGRDLQPHNFPRGIACNPGAVIGAWGERSIPLRQSVRSSPFGLRRVKAAARGMLAKAKTPADKRAATVANVLGTLTRSVVVADPDEEFHIVDYAGVEARGIAWVAGCAPALSIFSNHKADIYCDMASKLFGRTVTKRDKDERFVGKQIVLGCGYGMGANKFDAGCKIYLVDLPAVGVTAKQCVDSYRSAYPEIPKVWKAYDKAAMQAVKTGREQYAGRCIFRKVGSWLHIVLPSGRALKYRDVVIGSKIPPWGPPAIPALFYTNPYGFQKNLYGGMIAENIVQAVCRDILVHAMLKLDPTHRVLLHIHDEIIFGVRRGTPLAEVCGPMSEAPDWAPGFPVGVEGFASPRYTKFKFPGQREENWLNGAQV